MTGILIIYVVLIILFVLLTGFYEGSETGVISANRLRLRNLKLAGDEKAADILNLLGDTQKIIAVSLVGTNLFTILGTLTAEKFFVHLIPKDWEINILGLSGTAEIVTLAFMTPVFLIFAQIIPKQIFRLHADTMLFKVSKLIKISRGIFLPISLSLSALARTLLSLFGVRRGSFRTTFSKQDLMHLVHPEEPTADYVTTEKEMIHGIFGLEQTMAFQVMMPLVDVVSIRLGDMSTEGFLNLARRTGYTRFPVFRDRVVNMIGYIDVYDILTSSDPAKPLENFISEPYYVPETKRIDDLLHEFLEKGLRIAFVVDEYGGCSGIVTREDLLEEIIGEIEDEFDAEATSIVKENDGSCIIDGQVDIDDVNERLGLDIPKLNSETIGGLVLSSLGRIPQKGESVYHRNYIIEVLELDHLRVAKVRIRPRVSVREHPSKET